MSIRAIVAAVLTGAALMGAGCSSMDDYSGPRTLIPARQLNVSPSLHIPAEGLIAAAVIFYVVDPLAPNWKVQVEPIGPQRYRVNLTMKRFITGGEGESSAVFRRTAEKLQQDGGRAGYAVLAYQEGIDSNVLIAQRVASGVVELR
jgi:hypothetical protein